MEKCFLFQGYFWHSCPPCYPDRASIHPVKGISHRENYDHTVRGSLEGKGTLVIEQWECTFRAGMSQEQKRLFVRVSSIRASKTSTDFSRREVRSYSVACQGYLYADHKVRRFHQFVSVREQVCQVPSQTPRRAPGKRNSRTR